MSPSILPSLFLIVGLISCKNKTYDAHEELLMAKSEAEISQLEYYKIDLREKQVLGALSIGELEIKKAPFVRIEEIRKIIEESTLTLDSVSGQLLYGLYVDHEGKFDNVYLMKNEGLNFNLEYEILGLLFHHFSKSETSFSNYPKSWHLIPLKVENGKLRFLFSS